MENDKKMRSALRYIGIFLLIILVTVLGLLTIRLSKENQDLKNSYGELKTDYDSVYGELNKLKNEIEEETVVTGNTAETVDENVIENTSTQSIDKEAQLEPPEDDLSIAALTAGEVLPDDEINRADLASFFTIDTISAEILERINGKSYYENPDITLDDLRYMKIIHYNFEHNIQVGELIVNANLAEDFKNIFTDLFQEEYEIQSMLLIDNYWTGDADSSDSASIDANNTSAFCYRHATGSTKLSNHAFGRAIDINPQQNPYVTFYDGTPSWSHSNADAYINRESGEAHVITHGDICYKIFLKYGFSWGGDWDSGVKDYQHFEKP